MFRYYQNSFQPVLL